MKKILFILAIVVISLFSFINSNMNLKSSKNHELNKTEEDSVKNKKMKALTNLNTNELMQVKTTLHTNMQSKTDTSAEMKLKAEKKAYEILKANALANFIF